MKIVNTNFFGLKKIKGRSYYDKRGFFRELFKEKLLKGYNFKFWCLSKSKRETALSRISYCPGFNL